MGNKAILYQPSVYETSFVVNKEAVAPRWWWWCWSCSVKLIEAQVTWAKWLGNTIQWIP